MLNKNPVQKNPNLPYLRVGGIKPFKNLESSLYNVMLRRISLKRLLRGTPPNNRRLLRGGFDPPSIFKSFGPIDTKIFLG